ncbi:hypothetical protein AB0F68_06785 [Micromonospora sp. NPDC023966]|uniref:5-methylcytosine restriction system specificity protein McrC n=1 Tax=Micromonospora sp. NPDC023966 TaxID=3154699 RepID=UPI0033D2EC1A
MGCTLAVARRGQQRSSQRAAEGARVRVALRDTLRANPAEFPSGNNCPPLALDAHRRVRLKPDLSYWPRGQCAFIGDVKYKRDTGPGHSSDLYQLLVYATAAQLPAATLVYADGPPEPHTHLIPTAKVHLYVQHLDLTKPPKDLLEQVERLGLHLTTPDAKGPSAA